MLYQVNYLALGQRIREAREKRALTQAQLAEIIGISPQFMGNLERGMSKPSLQTVFSLSRALDTPLDGLLCDSASAVSSSAHTGSQRDFYVLRDPSPVLCNTLSDWLSSPAPDFSFPDVESGSIPVNLRELPPLGFLALDEDFPSLVQH